MNILVMNTSIFRGVSRARGSVVSIYECLCVCVYKKNCYLVAVLCSIILLEIRQYQANILKSSESSNF